MSFDDVSYSVISACIEVHRHLGPGLLESAYQACVAHELERRAIPFRQQVLMPLEYKALRIEGCYRLDFIVAGEIVLELKSVEKLLPVHESQVLTYLRITSLGVGLLINFNVPTLRSGGLRRLTLREK